MYCLKHFFYNNGERPLFLDAEMTVIEKYETQNFRYKYGGSVKELYPSPLNSKQSRNSKTMYCIAFKSARTIRPSCKLSLVSLSLPTRGKPFPQVSSSVTRERERERRKSHQKKKIVGFLPGLAVGESAAA